MAQVTNECHFNKEVEMSAKGAEVSKVDEDNHSEVIATKENIDRNPINNSLYHRNSLKNEK